MDVRLDESPCIIELRLDCDVLGFLFFYVLRSEHLQLAVLQRRLGIGGICTESRLIHVPQHGGESGGTGESVGGRHGLRCLFEAMETELDGELCDMDTETNLADDRLPRFGARVRVDTL